MTRLDNLKQSKRGVFQFCTFLFSLWIILCISYLFAPLSFADESTHLVGTTNGGIDSVKNQLQKEQHDDTIPKKSHLTQQHNRLLETDKHALQPELDKSELDKIEASELHAEALPSQVLHDEPRLGETQLVDGDLKQIEIPDRLFQSAEDSKSKASNDASPVFDTEEIQAVERDLKGKVIEMVLGLSVVLAILYGFLHFYKRSNLYKTFHQSPMNIVSVMALSPKQKIGIIEVLGNYVVVGMTDHAISHISTLNENQKSVLRAHLTDKKPHLNEASLVEYDLNQNPYTAGENDDSEENSSNKFQAFLDKFSNLNLQSRDENPLFNQFNQSSGPNPKDKS